MFYAEGGQSVCGSVSSTLREVGGNMTDLFARGIDAEERRGSQVRALVDSLSEPRATHAAVHTTIVDAIGERKVLAAEVRELEGVLYGHIADPDGGLIGRLRKGHGDLELEREVSGRLRRDVELKTR